VQEWCKDWYVKDYQPGDQGDKLNRVIRGGAWNSSARDCRVAHRRAEDPARSDVATGFRVVVRLREKEKPKPALKLNRRRSESDRTAIRSNSALKKENKSCHYCHVYPVSGATCSVRPERNRN